MHSKLDEQSQILDVVGWCRVAKPMQAVLTKNRFPIFLAQIAPQFRSVVRQEAWAVQLITHGREADFAASVGIAIDIGIIALPQRRQCIPQAL